LTTTYTEFELTEFPRKRSQTFHDAHVMCSLYTFGSFHFVQLSQGHHNYKLEKMK